MRKPVFNEYQQRILKENPIFVSIYAGIQIRAVKIFCESGFDLTNIESKKANTSLTS